MKRRSWPLGFTLAVALTACGTPLQYVSQTNRTHPARGTAASVQILHGEPRDSYDVLGFIQWDYYQPGWRAPNITDVLPRLQTQAWAVGGDALIVRKQDVGVTDRHLRIVADVIRWRR